MTNTRDFPSPYVLLFIVCRCQDNSGFCQSDAPEFPPAECSAICLYKNNKKDSYVICSAVCLLLLVFFHDYTTKLNWRIVSVVRGQLYIIVVFKNRSTISVYLFFLLSNAVLWQFYHCVQVDTKGKCKLEKTVYLVSGIKCVYIGLIRSYRAVNILWVQRSLGGKKCL